MAQAVSLAKAREKAFANPKTISVPALKKAKPSSLPELVCTGEEITHDQIHAWIKEHAGGQPKNVAVLLMPNVAIEDPKPIPFFSNQTYEKKGVRYLDLMDHLKGVKGETNLAAIWASGARRGTSAKKNAMTWFLLNGGQSRSSKSWGTSFIKLVAARPPSVVA